MITEKELYEALLDHEKDILNHQEDVKQLKKDAKFHKDDNPGGIPKEDVALIGQVAKLEAKRIYEEFKQKASAVSAKYEQLTGYND